MDKNGTAVSEWYLACPCVGLQLLLMEYAIKQLHRCIFFSHMLIQLHCFRSQIHFVFLLQLPLLGAEHYQFSCFCLFFHSAFEGLLSPSSLSYMYQSTSHPNDMSPCSVSGRKSIFWLNTSIFIVLYADKRSTGLTHWKTALGSCNATTQYCRPPWLLPARFLQRNQVLSSQKKRSLIMFCWVSGKRLPHRITMDWYTWVWTSGWQDTDLNLSTLAKFIAAKQKPARYFLQQGD